jgi:two-component system, NarL family, sensor histidine kinase BarA
MEDTKTFDWSLCLKKCNNNPALAKELFDLFISELPEFYEKILHAEKMKNKKALLDVIHKLHGACCYIGVPRLKDLVADTEQLLKQNKTDAPLQGVAEILDEIQKIERISQPEKYQC